MRVEPKPADRVNARLDRMEADLRALQAGGFTGGLRIHSPSGAYVEIRPQGAGIALRVVNSSGVAVQEWTAG